MQQVLICRLALQHQAVSHQSPYRKLLDDSEQAGVKPSSYAVIRSTSMEVCYLLFLSVTAVLCLQDKAYKGPVPGGLRNTSKNDPGVKKAVISGTNAYNNQSNDAFLFKASAIDSAQKQIVKGVLYHLKVELSRTVCRKSSRGTDLAHCTFQPQGDLQQTFLCDFKVWSIPWLHQMTTTHFHCSPSPAPQLITQQHPLVDLL
ncbi:cystatin-2 [Engraulis encrasicolus]|uniref:cystatin-2 n=1 Tax=Engraulis encrasicolus TaxID=184585 RepID=UPI002FD52608